MFISFPTIFCFRCIITGSIAGREFLPAPLWRDLYRSRVGSGAMRKKVVRPHSI